LIILQESWSSKYKTLFK